MNTTGKPILSALPEGEHGRILALLDSLIDRSAGPDACHPWTGGSRNRGYGVTDIRLGRGKRRIVKVHRIVYEIANDGASPPVVDHACHDPEECTLGDLCPHRLCCNPRHLVASTRGVNAGRGRPRLERCKSGRHRLTPDNVRESSDGKRGCRECQNAAQRRRRTALPARSGRNPRRPVGMTPEQTVAWALGDAHTDECIYWPGGERHPHRRVEVKIGERVTLASRLVHEVRVGPIPPGYVVDHACHDPAECPGGPTCPHGGCINPRHLVAVTRSENSAPARAAHRVPDRCPADHPYDAENTYVDARGSRHCRECTRSRLSESRTSAREGVKDGRRRQGNTCKNGRHDVTVTGLTDTGRCRQCDLDAHREKDRRRRAAAKADPAWRDKRLRQDGKCSNGHDLAVVGITGPKNRCRQCRRDEYQASKARATQTGSAA